MSINSNVTILVVEDDPRIRGLVKKALTKAGYLVLEARGGVEALAIMRSHTAGIPLALLDIMMPDMNGLDLANQMRVERPDTRILYMSGLEDSIAVDTITRAEPKSMLPKPFTPKQLIARIEQLLQS